MKMKKLFAAVMGICLAATNLTMLPAGLSTAAEETAVQYDVNADGAFDILDIISLTKYLHLEGKLTNLAAGDMNADHEVDVFDLDLMMRALVGMEPETPQPSAKPKLLSADYTSSDEAARIVIDDNIAMGQTKFALGLLQQTMQDGKNVMVSPYSVEQALGMTANGASGKTLAEMEDVLGGDIDTLNSALYTLRTNAEDNTEAKFSTANSIWIREDYDLNPAFLQKNADYYGADAYKAPFNDETLSALNNWVDTKTDHMVPQILEEFPEDSMLVLLNAVAFDAKWYEPYSEDAIWKGEFTKTDGSKQEVEMMYSNEKLHCLKDDHAIGYRKGYQGGYYFAALLPEKGMTPEEYLAQLTPQQLRGVLKSDGGTVGYHGIPAFSYDFDTSLKDSLSAMGMPTAFTEKAIDDFKGMYTNVSDGICIGDVIHKTHIEVNSAGTRAGAATAVIMTECATVANPEETETVILDRPFVYMIVDSSTDVPLFIGTVNSVEAPAESPLNQ